MSGGIRMGYVVTTDVFKHILLLTLRSSLVGFQFLMLLSLGLKLKLGGLLLLK